MSLTEKQIAGNQRRSLRTMRQKLLEMADQWDGIDQFNMSELTELADKMDSVAASMVDDESSGGHQ